MMRIAEKPAGTTLEWNDVAGALYYNVIRGDLAGLQETDASIDLGNVNCLKATSLTPHTVGWEDSATPASGDVFFYLVEYFDGWNTSYGTASAAMSRTVTSGACK